MADAVPRFGASDFFLVETDAGQLRERLRSALAALLGRDVEDSDPHMVVASAFLPFLVQGQASADACAKATLRAFARGSELNRIADSTCVVGYLDRLPARPAVLACVLSVTVTRSSFSGESMCAVSWSASRVASFQGGEPVTFSGAGSFSVDFGYTEGASKTVNVPVYLLSDVKGTAGNGVLADGSGAPALIQDDDLSVTASVEADAPADVEYTVEVVKKWRAGAPYGGADAEDDDAFALRTLWQAKALRVPGSYEYFLLALSDLHLLASWYLSPSVDDDGRIVLAYADKSTACAAGSSVTLYTTGEAYDQYVRRVRESLMVDQRAYVYDAEEYDGVASIVVYFTIPATTTDEDGAKNRVINAWRVWVSSVAWHCGALLSETDATSALVAAGAESVWIDGSDAAIHGRGLRLPVDRFVPASRFAYSYAGLGTASAAPVGGGGEEILP